MNTPAHSQSLARNDAHRSSMVLAVCLSIVSQVSPLRAQSPAGASAANPAVVTQRIENLRPPPPPAMRQVDSSVVGTPLTIDRAAAGDPTTFFVKTIVFEGAARLPQARLRKFASGYEGKEVTLGQMEILARRVRVLARSKGYLVADAFIPTQDVAAGTVRIIVTESRYGKVAVRGAHYYSEGFVRRFFAPAVAHDVVFGPDLYRSLLILNEYPDLSVQAQFAPGKQPFTTDVVLNVKDALPVHVGLDYNNFGNRLVGRNRVGATLFAGNTFTPGDEVLIRAVDSWPGRSHIFWNAGYTIPVSRLGTKVGFQFADAETHVRGGALTVLDIRGDANTFTLLATHPLKRSFTQVQNVSATLSAKTVKNFFFGTLLTSQDDLRVLTLGHDGARGDQNGRWIHAAVLSQGLGTALGGNRNSDPQSSRVGSGNEFTKANLDVLRSQDLKRNRYALLRLSAQVTSDPLPTAEQFGIGGPDSVRGFIQSEALGDDGYVLSAEYRQQVWKSKDNENVVQGVAFVDHGHVSLELPQVAERASRSLTGVGLGARAAVGLNSSVRLDLGVPISQAKNVDGDDVVLYAQAATRF